MNSKPDTHDLVQEFVDNGFDKNQERRFYAASEAAKIAAVTVMTARYGTSANEIIESLTRSKRLMSEFENLFEAGTECHEFVLYVHSGTAF